MPNDFDDRSLNAPESLTRDLRATYSAPRVPGEIDRFVLNAARADLARSGRLRLWLRAGGAAAVAAVVVVASGIYLRTSSRDATAPPVTVAQSSQSFDVNADGKVDILDALRAAHRNGGRDRVDAIAMAAVAVREATP